jgi:methionyl-tRNA formyltransferase
MKAIFLGSKDIGISILNCLRIAAPAVSWKIVHPNEHSDPRSALDSFRQYASINNLDFLIASSPAEAKRIVLKLSPDIVFVCGWYWLMDHQTIAAVPRGVFGMHHSLLPKYRGGAPLVWSIINGDAEVGSSIFRFTPGMDDGDILLQVRVANEPHDTVATLLDKITAGVVDSLPAKWQQILVGSAILSKQNESDATYCGQRIPDDGHIDWRWSARQVHDFVRAQTTPYPGAFALLSGRKVVILRTEIDSRVFQGMPGQVLLRKDDKVVIACGQATAIVVCAMSIDGSCVVPTSAIRSISTRLG